MEKEEEEDRTLSLPAEILLLIFRSFLPSPRTLLTVVRLVCRRWKEIVDHEVRSGRIRLELVVDGERRRKEGKVSLLEEMCETHCEGARSLRLEAIEDCGVLQEAVDCAFGRCPNLRKLVISRCDCSKLVLRGRRWTTTTASDDEQQQQQQQQQQQRQQGQQQQLTSISITDCKTSTGLWEELSLLGDHLTELVIPDVPTGLLPLVLHNKSSVITLEVGIIPNQLIHLICSRFSGRLRSLSFRGDETTYSGIASLLLCKETLTELRIRDPRYLTRHSLRLLSGLGGLKVLRLYWLGRMLISNPWSFDYCMDRREQKVDNLFAETSDLRRLEHLDLSAFYQTVDNKLVQFMCLYHLSSSSIRDNNKFGHLRHVSLAHCYQVSDAGVQWLVGSCYSRGLEILDLSGTALTGNCFLRPLPRLHTLTLDCCTSLSSSGLASVASSCGQQLRRLSLAKCKQLADQDMMQMMTKLVNLEELDLSYTNVSGTCFKGRKTRLRRLSMNSCPKVRDETLGNVMERCSELKRLDVSATRIDGSAFLISGSSKVTSLYVDFCPRIDDDNLLQSLPVNHTKLVKVSGYGCAKLDSVWAENLKSKMPGLECLEVSQEEPSSSSVSSSRESDRARSLHLTDWVSTRRRMTRGMPGLLSQIWLTSVE